MPLSKFYTKKKVRQLVELWMQQLNQESLNPDIVSDFIDMALLEIFEDLDGGALEDYGRTVVISNQANNIYTSQLPTCTYIDSTKTITCSIAHGLTSSNIGARLVLMEVYDDQPVIKNLIVTAIDSIPSTLTLKVKDALGANLPSTTSFGKYAVLSKFSSTSFSLSGVKWKLIRKISDSLNGEVVKITDSRTWENLADYPQYERKVCWMQHGEDLFFFKGAQVASWGILTAYIWGYPEISNNEDALLDIKDNFIPLVLSKVQNLVISHLKGIGKGNVDPRTDNKAMQVGKNLIVEKEIVSK